MDGSATRRLRAEGRSASGLHRRRLDCIDEQARWEHDERERRRWYESQQRFEFGIRAMFWGLGVTFGLALALIVFQLAGRA